MEFRKVVIIGVAPGEMAGDLTRGHQTVLTRPQMKRDELTDVLIESPVGGIEKVVDAEGKDITYPRFGARPAREFGPDDPGDEGLPTIRLRAAFLLPVAPGQEKPLPRYDRAGNELASWTNPSRIPNATKVEVDALRGGALIERVIDEAGGQRSIDEYAVDETGRTTTQVLLDMWGAMVSEIAAPGIAGKKTIPNHPLLGAAIAGSRLVKAL